MKKSKIKILVSALILLNSSGAFAASTLFCTAEDGTKVTATESPDKKGDLFDVKISIRGHQEKSYPDAYAAKIEDSNGAVTFLVITDPTEGILVVVKDGSLIDATGVYEVESCELGM